jgi:hypothetical protein
MEAGQVRATVAFRVEGLDRAVLPARHVQVLETDGVDLDEPILMQTTTGGIQEYRRAGVIRFQVDGQPTEVTLYRSEGSDELFLPFRDATSGGETYGAGRYLEVDPPRDSMLVEVDLNYAYNPYCAYNPDWACPIPPIENWLRVPIRGGERTFPGRARGLPRRLTNRSPFVRGERDGDRAAAKRPRGAAGPVRSALYPRNASKP